MMHLKGQEKGQKETKRKADKEQLEKSRREEEARESQRAARKLNFLITQTELYSHFVGSKLKSEHIRHCVHVRLADDFLCAFTAGEAEESEETAGTSTANQNGAPSLPPEAALIEGVANGELKALDFGDADESNLLSHARQNALAAAEVARNKAKQFDQTYASEQAASKENYVLDDEDGDSVNGGDAAMNKMAGLASDKQDKAMAKIDRETALSIDRECD